MIHEIDTNAKPAMGVACTCGKRFPVPKAIEKHIEEANAEEAPAPELPATRHQAPVGLARTATPLEQKLERLAEIRSELALLDPLKAELDELKYEIMIDMQANQSKRTEPVAGIFAVRATRTSVRIDDVEMVSDWLEANLFDVSEYYKLDEARVKALAEERLKPENGGEIVPGLTAVESEYLTIKESK